jgi:hypothetical protein
MDSPGPTVVSLSQKRQILSHKQRSVLSGLMKRMPVENPNQGIFNCHSCRESIDEKKDNSAGFSFKTGRQSVGTAFAYLQWQE